MFGIEGIFGNLNKGNKSGNNIPGFEELYATESSCPQGLTSLNVASICCSVKFPSCSLINFLIVAEIIN